MRYNAGTSSVFVQQIYQQALLIILNSNQRFIVYLTLFYRD